MAISIFVLKSLASKWTKLNNARSILTTKPLAFKAVSTAEIKLAPKLNSDVFVRSVQTTGAEKVLTKSDELKNLLDELKKLNPKVYKHINNRCREGKIDINSLELILDSVKNPLINKQDLEVIIRYKEKLFEEINMYARKDPQFEKLPLQQQQRVKMYAERLKNCLSQRQYHKELTLHRGDSYKALNSIIIQSGKYRGKPLGNVLRNSEYASIDKKEELILDLLLNNEFYLSQKGFLEPKLQK